MPKPIGQSMIEANLISQDQLDEALEYQRNLENRAPLGRLTVELGMVKEDDFAPFLASYFNAPYLNLKEHFTVQKEALDIVPEAIARRLNVLPVLKEEDTLTVAISDPLDLPAIENLETITRCRIKSVVSAANQIRNRIESYYSGATLKKDKYRLPSARPLVAMFIEKAHKNSAGSVHIQLENNRVEILFRVDKKLEKVASYPDGVLPLLSEFIKKSANLDPENSDTPQAGYFQFSGDSVDAEIGVSILPTFSGERIVLDIPRRIGWLDEEAWFKSA